MTEAAKLAVPNHRDYNSIIGPTGDGLERALRQVSGKSSEAEKEASRQVSGKSSDGTAKGNSVLVTAGVIIGDTLGAGLLTMPGALSMFGWFVGSVFIVGMLALNLHICMLLWRMRMAFPQAHTLGELAEASFSRAPRWQRSLMRQVTDCVQYVFVFFLLAADATSFGKGFGLLFYDVHLCLPVWVLIGSAILLPIHARTRSLGGNKLSISFNCVAVTCCVGLCLRHFAHQGVLTSRGADVEFAAVAPMSALGILNGLNIMMFNFTIQFMVVEIASEMEKPQEFPRALWGYAFPFLAALFTICGMGGYYYLGDKAHGLLIGHLPFGMSLRFTAACLVFLVLVAYLLKSVVLCKTIHACCDPEHAGSDSARSEAGYTLTIALVLGAAFLVSQVVPFFTPFIDLIGATLAPLCCIVIPLVMYVQWHCTFGGRTDAAERVLILLEVALCVLIMTLGTYDSLLTIVRGWEEFGAPFSCHCELLWDTCGCSASKPGMSLCSPHSGWLDQAVSLYADSLGLLGGLESIRQGAGTSLWWY